MLLLFLIKEVIPLNKADLTKFFNGTKAKLSKNAPGILIGLAVVSGGAAVYTAITATPKALKRIEQEKSEKQVDKLTPMETVKAVWPYYVPTALSFAFATGCAIGSQSIHAHRNAALAAAYKISETALVEYRDKVIETIGEKKEKTVRDKVAQEQIDKHPVSRSEVIITGKGKSLCFDPLTYRYFDGDIETIRRAENKINRDLLQSICGSASLNEFYVEIGLPTIEGALGGNLGWSTDYLIDLDIHPGMSDDDRPCLVIGHNHPPKYDY